MHMKLLFGFLVFLLIVCFTSCQRASQQVDGTDVGISEWGKPDKTGQVVTRLSPIGNHFTIDKAKRTSTKFLHGQPVDKGLSGHGVTSYLSLMHELVVVDAEKENRMWSKRLTPDYSGLGYLRVKGVHDKDIILLGVFGDKVQRFYDLLTGERRYLEKRENTLCVLKVEPVSYRGDRGEVVKQITGSNSGVLKQRCVRTSNTKDWKKLWLQHLKQSDRVPEVNFEGHMVIALFHGQSQSVQEMTLEHFIECPESLELFMAYAKPEHEVEQKQYSPYAFYVVPRSKKKVIIKVREQHAQTGKDQWRMMGIAR